MGPVIRNVIRDVIRPVMGDEVLVSRFSPAVTDYFNRLGALRVTTYDAANAALIDRLVGNGGNFWPDSGAFCLMAGYLYPGNGEDLIPLKDGHDAGTLNAFVTGDWNAVTGLKGDGSTKYVDSNRNNNADGQDDNAVGVVVDTAQSSAGTFGIYIGAGGFGVEGAMNVGSDNGTAGNFIFTRSRQENVRNEADGTNTATGLVAMSRDAAANYLVRAAGSNNVQTAASQTPFDQNILVFARTTGAGVPQAHTNARLPFYHIGPNLSGTGELAELDAALTEWKNALASA